MPFQKGNKLGMKKAEEYEDMDKGESTGDDEEITVPFVSQYPEGRVSFDDVKKDFDNAEGVQGPEAKAVDDDLHPPIAQEKGFIGEVKDAIQRLPGLGVKLMFHGVLKDDGGKIIQRPIPVTSRCVDKSDVVKIGPDRIGVFTKDEAEYLLRVCKGAFTKVEGLS